MRYPIIHGTSDSILPLLQNILQQRSLIIITVESQIYKNLSRNYQVSISDFRARALSPKSLLWLDDS